MYRYLILVWQAAEAQQAAAARLVATRLRTAGSEWSVVLDTEGLMALHAGTRSSVNDACPLDNKAGVILGTLFSKAGDGSSALVRGSLGQEQSETILGNDGRHLLASYWGRYVAVLKRADSGQVHILRDPSGALPCYLTTHRGVHLLFSHVEDCARLALFPLSINWSSMRAIAAGLILQTGETTLNEVQEVRAGERIELHGERVKKVFCWNPVEVAQSDVIEDPDRAIDALRGTLLSCMQAWAACYPRIVHNLSGGLDSSIVLSCLSQASSQPMVTALHYSTSVADGDERYYARLAAQRCSCEIIERRIDPASVKLDRAFDASRSMNPAYYVFELLQGDFEKELAGSKGATAFFQGGGGDGVFLQNGAEYAPGDYVHRHGIRPHLFKVAHDAAQVTRLSMGSLVQRGIVNGLRKPRWRLQLGELGGTSFIHQQVHEWLVSQVDSFAPASLQQAADTPDGKRWHIFMSSFPPGFTRPYERFERPEIVFPLLSQPVHELCLRMPTYLMFHNGWDRAMARHAFAKDVPAEIIRRRGKGGADNLTKEILEANIDVIVDTLLNGQLVRQGILQRDKLETYLLNPRPNVETICNDVITLFETEVFLHSWRGMRQRAVA